MKYLIIDGVFCDRYGNPLKGAALYSTMAHHSNGGLKQTLDQNEELKDEKKRLNEALYYSLSLNHEQDKKIQHLENLNHEKDKEIRHLKDALGSVLPALGIDIPRFQ
ncbi:hypothetical protein Yangon222_03590 [Helicobacter pylori]